MPHHGAAVSASISSSRHKSKTPSLPSWDSSSEMITLGISLQPKGHPTETAAAIVQNAYREYRSRGKKLHRFNLAERLKFEWNVCCGAFRLFTQILTFVLLVVALQQTPTSTKRALYHSIEDAFDFAALKKLPNREDFFQTGLQLMADRSKDFFALSSRYFESEGGSVELLRNSESFTAPKIISALSLPLLLPEFSFSAWVRTNAQFTRGYLVRKRLVTAGAGSDLACFGWHLDQLNGPSLHFGASDFYPKGLTGADEKQERITLPSKMEFMPDAWHLLTVVITFDAPRGQQTVTFYRDLEEIGRTSLPRPITDCYNKLDGLLIGDTGLTLAQLRFYPRRLTPNLIKEIHVIGTVLEDVATGSQPPTQASSPLESLSWSLETTLAAVDQRLAAQQPRSEVDLVLQAVDQDLKSAEQARVSPAAPLGKLPVEASTRNDELIGREFTMLLEGPVQLTQPAEGEERYFDPETFPRWSGQGMAITLWVRKSADCGSTACGTYIMSAHPEGPTSSVRCWSAWVEKRGVYFDNPKSEEGFHYALDIMDERYHLTPNHWRHIAFVWDPDSDDWLFYQDGQLVYQVPWGSSVRDSDCSDAAMRVTVGARFPGWTYGVEDEVYDMRMWVGDALSASDVKRLATVETAPLNAVQFERAADESFSEYQARVAGFQHIVRCTPDNSDTMQDTAWRDLFGHSCAWYFFNVKEFPNLCELEEARLHCPIACKSLQPCIDMRSESESVYLAWDSIRRMEPRSANGTLCLSSELDEDEVFRQCQEWQSRGGWEAEAAAWLDDMVSRADGSGLTSKRVNLTSCEELLAAIDKHCTFDRQAVHSFTQEVKANGGDYTIGFWIKPLGENSLHDNGVFYPSVSFVSQLSPPNINLAFAKFGTGAHGEARVRSACEGTQVENVELLEANAEGWTFVAFSRTNSSTSSGLSVTDLGGMRESAGDWVQCLYDEEMLFNAVEVNYPVLISPIIMVPRAMPLSKLQEVYYLEVNDMQVRNGPIVTNRQRNATRIEVSKKDLQPRSVLMATPLLFSTRVEPTPECPFDYSNRLLAEQHSKVLASKCAFPFTCSAQVLEQPAQTIACAGAQQDSDTFFGLEPRTVNGNVGYADLLYSITDNQIVFRDEKLRETKDFIDAHTQQILILLVFFTPQYGITSVLQVSADVSGPSVDVSTSLQHYTILEGRALAGYIAVLCSVVLVALIMAADVLMQWRAMRRRHSEGHVADGDSEKKAKWFLDSWNVIMIIIYVILQLPTQINSARETDRILGTLAGIEWESSTVTLEEKKDVFFESVLALIDTIEWNSMLDSFLNVILLVSLLRIIQCTSLHPRLALLTGTLRRAMDDLWHTAILIVMIMVSFAGIATWRFGNQYDDFGSFEASMQTEFKLMFGEFLRYWGESRELQAFVVLYYMVMFLLILNFLLAIIVESYMKVRRYNEEIEYEDEFFTDLSFAIVAFFYGKFRGWPHQEILGRKVSKLRGKLSMGYRDLYRLGVFRKQQDVEDFLSFYSRLSCLEPAPVDSSGLGPNAGMSAESKRIVKEVAELMQVKVPKLKDVAREAHLRKEATGRATPLHQLPFGASMGSFRWGGDGASLSSREAQEDQLLFLGGTSPPLRTQTSPHAASFRRMSSEAHAWRGAAPSFRRTSESVRRGSSEVIQEVLGCAVPAPAPPTERVGQAQRLRELGEQLGQMARRVQDMAFQAAVDPDRAPCHAELLRETLAQQLLVQAAAPQAPSPARGNSPPRPGRPDHKQQRSPVPTPPTLEDGPEEAHWERIVEEGRNANSPSPDEKQ